MVLLRLEKADELEHTTKQVLWKVKNLDHMDPEIAGDVIMFCNPLYTSVTFLEQQKTTACSSFHSLQCVTFEGKDSFFEYLNEKRVKTYLKNTMCMLFKLLHSNADVLKS